MTARYKQVDKTITKAMLHAEKSITCRHSSQYEWSVPLAQALLAVKYWGLKIKQKQGKPVSQYILQATKDGAGFRVDIRAAHSWNDLTHELCLARDHLKSCHRDHIQLRELYLQGLAEDIMLHRCPFLASPKMAKVKAKRIAHELRELIKCKQVRRMYRKIGSCLNPYTYNTVGLTRIDVPAGSNSPYPIGPDPKTWNGSWESVTDPETMAAHICSSNT
jgi:hypothetical protein